MAREAGVSPSTASRVLNGSRRRVSAANVARVTQAGRRLGYIPNFAAQATAHGLAPICVVVVPDWDEIRVADLRAAVEAARERSLRALVLPMLEEMIGAFHVARAFMPAEIDLRLVDALVLADPLLVDDFADFEGAGGRLLVDG